MIKPKMSPTAIVNLIILIFLSACVSQRDIEIACLQTLSVITPICMCDTPIPKENLSSSTPTPPAVTNENPPQMNNTPVSPQPASIALPAVSNVIFRANFENGEFSPLFAEPNGDYFGKGIFYSHKVVSEPAIGNYSAALTIGSGDSTAAYLFVYRVPATPLAVYSVDYWVPQEIIPGTWWNVWQWKSINEYFDKPIIDLDILRIDGILQVVMFYTPGGISNNETQTVYQTKPISFPTDRWVNITAHFLSKDDGTGFATIFQDGQKILELTNIHTRPGNEPVLWSINSYADEIFPNPATIYIDNVTIGEAQQQE